MPTKHTVSMKEDVVTIKKDIKDLTIIVGNAFQKVDKKFVGLEENLGNRIQGVQNSLDAHLLDCVTRGEHDRLTKRVRVLEAA
jgi:hypothetical protein